MQPCMAPNILYQCFFFSVFVVRIFNEFVKQCIFQQLKQRSCFHREETHLFCSLHWHFPNTCPQAKWEAHWMPGLVLSLAEIKCDNIFCSYTKCVKYIIVQRNLMSYFIFTHILIVTPFTLRNIVLYMLLPRLQLSILQLIYLLETVVSAISNRSIYKD